MNTTYLKILQTLESFASAHLQVRRFKADFTEQLQNFGTESEQYPILYVSPEPSVFNNNDFTSLANYSLRVYALDVIQKDRANINNILNNTALILNDLHKWLKEGDIPGISVGDISTITPINNYALDYVAGWQMVINLEVETYSVCQIPFENSPVISVYECDIVYNQWQGPPGPPGPPGGGSGGIVLYLDSTDATYTTGSIQGTLDSTALTSTQTTIQSTDNNNTRLVASFTSSPSVFSKTTIDSGLWWFHLYGSTSGGDVSFYFDVSYVDSDGVSNKTLIVSGDQNPVAITDQITMLDQSIYAGVKVLPDLTKRLVVDLYVITGAGNRTTTLYFRDETNSHVHTPILPRPVVTKKTNITLDQATWVTGSGLWQYNYSDGDVQANDSIDFTPYNSTIGVVINAVVLPQISTSTGQFTLYSQNQPAGDIEGEYLIIKTD